MNAAIFCSLTHALMPCLFTHMKIAVDSFSFICSVVLTGTMLVGAHKGAKVQDAKPLVRAHLLETKQAVPYAEPASEVVSRSGDVCVVALTDQWYITYGEPEWREQANQYVFIFRLRNNSF